MPDEIFYFKDSEIPAVIAEIPSEIFQPVRAGLMNETQVEIEYENTENRLKRKILPEVLFRTSEVWYVAAYCFLRGEPRTFRFDRILSAAVTDIRENSYGIAEDIRRNGTPWNRPPKTTCNPEVREKPSGLWAKVEIVPGKNGPEVRIDSSNKGDGSSGKTAREFSVDLVYDAERGNIIRMKEDLAAGADINFVSGTGNTPFTAAAARGDLAMMRFLIEHGANPFVRTLDEATALMAATRSGDLDAVRYLVEKLHLYVNTADCRWWTPLFYAVLGRHFEIMEYFLAHGADINCRDRKKRTLLMEAIDNARPGVVPPLKFIEKLIQEGINIHAEDRDERTALYSAIENMQPEIVRFLLDSGVSVSHFDRYGASPLLFAFRHYDEMSSRRIEPCTPEPCGELDEIVRILIEHGADIQASDRQGVTPLMLAHGENLTCLLKNGACVNAFDRQGKTVAMYHCSSFKELDRLIEYGADLSARDFQGDDILSYVPGEYSHIRDFVMRYGVPVTNRNNNGDTLLNKAAHEKFLDWALIKFLIRHGADPLEKNKDGNFPTDRFPLECIYRKETLLEWQDILS